MESPITGKPMKMVKTPEILEFRKDKFEIIYHSYLCEDSGEEFTNDALDTLNQVQVHNLYREKYGIPFPDQIRSIREKYGISASKMAEILGFGPNQYRLYEAGEMPSLSNGRLILAVQHPKDFRRQVEASAHLLGEKETQRILDKTEKLMQKQKEELWEVLFCQQIFSNNAPNEFSGFRQPNYEKISQMVSYFSQSMDLYKTKLNKLLFYADFGHFQKTGYSISGLTYRAIPYGPVPSEYDKLFIKLVDDAKIQVHQKPMDSQYAELFESLDNFDAANFSESELQILELVNNKFKNLKTKQVVELSHHEKAWIANQDNRELISYQQFGFELSAL